MSDLSRGKEYLGRGLNFPLQIDARGGLALTNPVQDIEQAIRIILGTMPSERVMRPEFGSRIHELVFAPNDLSTQAMARLYVEEALERWEPRIKVVNVAVAPDPERDGTLLLDIRYEIKDTHDQRSIVYPLYLTGAEE